jgi:hypothetical protein
MKMCPKCAKDRLCYSCRCCHVCCHGERCKYLNCLNDECKNYKWCRQCEDFFCSIEHLIMHACPNADSD